MQGPQHDSIGTSKAALISYDEAHVMCVARELSEGVVGLSVVTTKNIPDHFTLTIKGEEKGRACTVQWRKPNQLGVSFD